MSQGLLVGLLSNRSLTTQCHATEILGALAKNHPENQKKIVDAGAVPKLVDLLGHGKTKSCALFSLGVLAKNHQKMVVEAGILPKLGNLLDNRHGNDREYTLRMLADLARKHPQNQTKIAAAGIRQIG